MRRKDKDKILEVVKNCACFYQIADNQYRLELSVNIKNENLISKLRKFFTED